MVWMRIEISLELWGLKVIDAPGRERMLTRHQRNDDPRLGRMAFVVDTREEASNFVGAEKRALMDTLRPAGRGRI